MRLFAAVSLYAAVSSALAAEDILTALVQLHTFSLSDLRSLNYRTVGDHHDNAALEPRLLELSLQGLLDHKPRPHIILIGALPFSYVPELIPSPLLAGGQWPPSFLSLVPVLVLCVSVTMFCDPWPGLVCMCVVLFRCSRPGMELLLTLALFLVM